MNKLTELRDELNGIFLEREDVVQGLICALLAEEHIKLLGPPGTAKSMLARCLAESLVGSKYFVRLLTKTTTPEEVFGPLKLSSLENDVYERKTDRYLPDADIVFLDEMYRGSSAILNALLTAINEREFDNDGRKPIPLKLCIGASNDLPEGRDLDAFGDRFLLRYWISPIRSRKNREALLKMNGSTVKTKVTRKDLAKAVADRSKVEITRTVRRRMLDVWDRITEEGFSPSDRRWRKSLALVQAMAYLDGRKKTRPSDLAILSDVLWNDPKNRAELRTIVLDAASPVTAKVTAIVDAARSKYKSVPKQDGNNRHEIFRRGEDAQKALHQAKGDLEKLKEGTEDEELTEVEDAYKKVSGWGEDVEQRLVKASIGGSK